MIPTMIKTINQIEWFKRYFVTYFIFFNKPQLHMFD